MKLDRLSKNYRSAGRRNTEDFVSLSTRWPANKTPQTPLLRVPGPFAAGSLADSGADSWVDEAVAMSVASMLGAVAKQKALARPESLWISDGSHDAGAPAG